MKDKKAPDRKSVEQALHESEKKYRDLYDNAPDMYHSLDAAGIIIDCNETEARMLGYEKEEIIGRPLTDFLTEESKRLFERDFPKLNKEKRQLNLERVFVRKDGTTFTASLNVFSQFDGDGRLTGTRTIARDITERKQMEEALREERDRAQKYLDIAGAMFVVIGYDQKVTLINKKGCEILGYKEDEVVGKNWFDNFLPKGIRREVKGVFSKLMAGEIDPLEYFENSVLTREGEERIIAWHNTLLKDDEGKIIGALSSGEDVTERKQAEQQIRDIIDAAPDIIHVISPKMEIINRNIASKSLFPHVREGDHCYATLHKRDRPCTHCGVTKVFKDGKKHDHESTISLPGGGKMIVHSTSAPIFDEKGQVVAAVEILHDITKRKEAEKELTMYAQQLEKSNRLKDLFTDIMRHDLLNPVDVVKNLAELLMEEEKYKDSEDIKMIAASARKTEEMIIATAAYAKLESAVDIGWEDMDLNAIIKDAEEIIKPYFEEKHIELEHLPEGKYIARTVLIVGEVFVNFLSNAMKYSPEDSKVTVDIEDMGKNWRVTVADQGTGVPEKYKEKIFDRFTRRKKEGVRGSGIGLAIVKRIADLHGGTTGVLDNPGGGSIFYFEIPKKAEVKT